MTFLPAAVEQTRATLRRLTELAPDAARLWVDGQVTRVVGMLVEAYLGEARVGDLCHIASGGRRVPAEVAGFADGRALLMPQGDLRGVAAGARVIRRGHSDQVAVGDELLGRVVDAFGQPLDGGPPPELDRRRALHASPPPPIARRPVDRPLMLGIRVIDGLLTCGQGQRTGILAGPGVGKTVLLTMMAHRAACDVLVMALVGERGREVAAFMRALHASETAARTVMVAATSDRPPLERLRAAHYATTVAEHFRDQGRNVLLVMDSLTRVAMAQREVGLAAGEPPTTKGYPPSVFARMPPLVERAGAAASGGSITGIYTVLMEGDDMTDPVADTAIGLLDGQILLSRRLAGQGHFPAVDVLKSTSRVMDDVVTPEHAVAARRLRQLLGVLADNEDLLTIGAYQAGQNAELDLALARREELMTFLRQDMHEVTPPAETIHWLTRLGGDGEQIA